jgi:mono/diheme cytochrome c family protein
MAVIFIALSLLSFLDSRGQVVPTTVTYVGHEAVRGKQVFQAYNCMGCHTIVGNGAYLGPDLTKLYAHVGPAWLEAFLPSAGSWPTKAIVQVQLQNPDIAEEAGVNSLDAYFRKYPAAEERVLRRGGHATIMPNLPFTHDEIRGLIAFLKYTSQMDTEGWPPVPRVAGLTFPHAKPMPASESLATNTLSNQEAMAVASDTPENSGEQLAQENGCIACHATDKTTRVGPGWGGLYGSEVQLADGSKVTIDDAYLTEAIKNPDAQIAAGFPAGVMPSYANILDAGQVEAIVAYIRSLEGEKQ